MGNILFKLYESHITHALLLSFFGLVSIIMNLRWHMMLLLVSDDA